jgi:RNA polymerase sigma factor (sigma-70 family)
MRGWGEALGARLSQVSEGGRGRMGGGRGAVKIRRRLGAATTVVAAPAFPSKGGRRPQKLSTSPLLPIIRRSFRLNSAKRVLTLALVSEPSQLSADFDLAQRCLEGDTAAIAKLRDSYTPSLVAYLRQKGGSEILAEEVTGWLWADILGERVGYRPRLANYAGQAALKTWLCTVALNRLIQRQRYELTRTRFLEEGFDLEKLGPFPGDTGEPVEAPLIELMRAAVSAAFLECPPADFVMLQLAHVDQLHQAELAKMFGCSRAKIGRDLEEAAKKMADVTLNHIRKQDPWLVLKWEDFVELCQVASPSCFGME